jgi:hypothetical protein
MLGKMTLSGVGEGINSSIRGGSNFIWGSGKLDIQSDAGDVTAVSFSSARLGLDDPTDVDDPKEYWSGCCPSAFICEC